MCTKCVLHAFNNEGLEYIQHFVTHNPDHFLLASYILFMPRLM